MQLDEAMAYLGKRVHVLCVDGDVFDGLLCGYESVAEHLDEGPDSVTVDVPGEGLFGIPTNEIGSIEEL